MVEIKLCLQLQQRIWPELWKMLIKANKTDIKSGRVVRIMLKYIQCVGCSFEKL